MHSDQLAPRLIASQILGVLQTICTANLLQQLNDIPASEAAADARATAELAFDLLEGGLADWPEA